MEFIHEIFYAVVCAEIFLCVQAQVTFVPDPAETVALNVTALAPVEVITVEQYNNAPIINVQYVTIDGSEAVYDVYNKTGGPLIISGTRPIQFRVTLEILKFIAEPALVGGTFRLRATIDNNIGNSTLSNRRYTFPAPFNLTGSSMSAILNRPFSWTCHTTPDNPGIDWLQDSQAIAQMSVHDNGSCNFFKQNESYPYTYSCQSSPLTYTLTIPGSSLTQDLQASTWRCKYPQGEVKGSKFMTLNIIVPVTNVSISPGSGSTLDLDEGQLVTFTCTTNNANPPPTILWYIGSSDVTSQAGTDRTTLTLNVTRAEHQVSVRCVAWNSGNQANFSDSTTLNVRFPPAENEELQITGYTSGQVLYENNPPMISINCTQPGGNPMADMTFSCGSQQGMKGDTSTEAIRRVDLANNRTLNGKMCNCVSTHINGFTQSKSVSVVVYYPPSVPTISASSLFPWKSEGTYNLTCNTTPGNPAVTTYIWKDEGSELLITSKTYKFKPLNSTDNERQLSCQVNNNFTLHENVVLTSDTTTLQVEYDPVVTLDQRSVEVIEGRTTVLRCSATGNPVPTVTWYRDTTPVTGSTISSSTYNITNTSRTLTGNYTCKATSSSTGSNILQPDEMNAHLRVFYPPTMQIHFQNTTENTGNHTIRCSAEGDPNNSTFVALQQMIESTLIRNITSFTESSPGNITLTIPRVSYQDLGTYTCLASNGIPDRSNHMVQSDGSYFNVTTSAKFEMEQYIVRSDIDTEAVVRIPFYRNPAATETDVVWIRYTGSSNETLDTSANVSLSLNDADVQQTFYGVDVTLRGQSATMNIPSFQNIYEGNYTLKIRSSHTDSAEVRITLIRSGPPDTPSDFQLLTRKVTSIVLTWNKGSDGGHPQTFVILYREKTSEIYTMKQLEDTTMNRNISYEIKSLQPGTSYEFLLYSFNEKGNSTSHRPLEERTLKAPEELSLTSLNSGLVGGAAGGGAAVLVMVIVIIVVVMRRRHNHGKGNDSKGISNSKEMLAGTSRQNDYDDGEDGLKDNPLYGSGASGTSGTSGTNAVQGADAAPENPSLYAEVVKPKKKYPAKVSEDPPPIYAEVDKSNKKGKGPLKPKKKSPTKGCEDPPPIYAAVNKPNKKGDKGKQTKQKAKGKIEGDVYENVDGFKENATQFNDHTEKPETKGNEPRGYRNQDGLLYVDVKFDQPPPTGKPIIRGEERTGYAMIEFEEPPTYSTADDVKEAEGGI